MAHLFIIDVTVLMDENSPYLVGVALLCFTILAVSATFTR